MLWLLWTKTHLFFVLTLSESNVTSRWVLRKSRKMSLSRSFSSSVNRPTIEREWWSHKIVTWKALYTGSHLQRATDFLLTTSSVTTNDQLYTGSCLQQVRLQWATDCTLGPAYNEFGNRFLCIKVTGTKVKQFGYYEHPPTTSSFLCIFLLVLSGTQFNWVIWTDKDIILTFGNISGKYCLSRCHDLPVMAKCIWSEYSMSNTIESWK